MRKCLYVGHQEQLASPKESFMGLKCFRHIWCWNKPTPGPWFTPQEYESISIPEYLAQSKYDNFGEVGNNRASRITCKCPVEFESIEYDTPREDWILKLDKSSGIFANYSDIHDQLNMEKQCFITLKMSQRDLLCIFVNMPQFANASQRPSWTN